LAGEPVRWCSFFVEPEPTLDVSLVVPMRNEARYFARFMESILTQDTRGISVEILLVDGDSTDGTREAVRRWIATDPRVRLLNNPACLVSPALNIGFRAARGRVLMRMDAHSTYEPDYIKQSLRLLELTGCSAVGGIQRPIPADSTDMARAIAGAQESFLGMGGGAHRRAGYEGPAKSLWLGAFRRELVETVGGFDETLFRTEDNEFYQRVRAAGGKLLLSHRIRASYICRSNLRGWSQQCFVTGSELIPTLIRNKRALEARHLAPGAALVTGLLVLAAASVRSGAVALAARILLAVATTGYAAAVAATSFAVRKRIGGGVFWPLLSVFPAAHLSYGLGTAWGIFRAPFALRRGPRLDFHP